MAYWLMKTEPSAFSIEDLMASPKQTTHWDGVRNYQARNFMRDQMRIGDGVLFYHSNCKDVGIVGTAEVVSDSYPDHTAFDVSDPHYDPKSDPEKPRWMMVDVQFRRRFDSTISLQMLREQPELADMLILRKGNRLSITPVSKEHWEAILAYAQ